MLPSDDKVHSEQSQSIIAGKDFLRTFKKEKKEKRKGNVKRVAKFPESLIISCIMNGLMSMPFMVKCKKVVFVYGGC